MRPDKPSEKCRSRTFPRRACGRAFAPTLCSCRPHQRTRAGPSDPTAGSNASLHSSAPIFHQSPRAAALVSESTSKPASARRRCSSVQVDAGSFSARQTRPLGRRWGLAACSTLRFQQQACRILQELSAARSHLRSWLRCSSWLGGAMKDVQHTTSRSVAGGVAGGPEGGLSHCKDLSQHVSCGLLTCVPTMM